ncbi:uncharacterized protein TNCV_1964481 [Trichonephila clavipes]|nr:uncharacterized protein TNCV_1964481 [Trichonephila clavipes]
MGNLPENRLSAGRAFLNVGIDFGGPFITKPNVSRSKVKLKSYLALFICMATKAVHLEVVSDLSADAFLAAFRRFISRRGKPTNMFSDNATNFKGASSYLKEQLKLIKSVEVQNFVTQESITWHFIPPTAAHIGGLWEAGIKSTKQLLIKTMKSAVLNFEELVTLVTQIEACLNSRPLTPLSNDPQDLQPLTPGHFLIGAPMASFPEEVPSQPACLKKRWNLIQHLRSQFWRRWHLEYLNKLQQRTKWNKPRRNLKVNDMVLVKEDNIPPLQWSLGRVVQVFPGDDGAVRVVDVKTQRGQFRRPITKCAYCQLKTELIVQAREYLLGNKTAELIKGNLGYNFLLVEILNAVQTRSQVKAAREERGIDSGDAKKGDEAIIVSSDAEDEILIPALQEYVPELALLRVTRENLINAQKNSEEIKSLYEQASSQMQLPIRFIR